MLISSKTPVIVQGITGRHGQFHTQKMLGAGARIVAGVTPGKAGKTVHGVPVFNTVKRALKHHRAQWSVLFVPAQFAKKAACEALRANLHIVIITEHIPVHDVIEVMTEAKRRKRIVIGPNCPGLTVVGQAKLGIMPAEIFKKGDVGVVSRSGTLTYEVVDQLTRAGIGQSTVIGIGGDRVRGFDFVDALHYFAKDQATKRIVMIGEIGGVAENHAADVVQSMRKPVVTFIAGRSAPPGKHMGHAGAIVYGANEGAQAKMDLLKAAGAHVVKKPSDIPKVLKRL